MRVLIVKVSSLGDIIHTLPAVTDAHRARRNLTFDWVIEENFVEVPSWHPAVDKVIPVAFRRWRKSPLKTYMNREFRSFRRLLQSEHYDLVIDAQGLIKSGVISRISRGLTVGLSNRTIREPLATLFYNKMYSVPWTEHAVDRVRQLFSRALKYSYNPQQIDYGIRLPELVVTEADDRPSIVFLHGTTWVTKHWPEHYWRHLAQLASSAGYRVLLPWGDDKEKARAEFIAAGIAAAEVLPRLSLSELAVQINAADGVIGVDTGLGHLAAALAKPAVTLYGPTNPGLSGTFGHNQLHLNSTLNCAPCIKKVCTYNGPGVTDEFDATQFPVVPACFASHRPELVWQQFQQLVSK